VSRMKALQRTIRKQMRNDIAVDHAAYRLLATSFYFERTSPIKALNNGNLLCTGMIKCRLPRSALGEFGRVLGTAHQRTEGPYFIIREQNRSQDAQQVIINPGTLSKLMFNQIWQLKPLEIVLSSPVAITEIVLCLKKNDEFPISGFPRTLQDKDVRSMGIRRRPSTADQCWRNRTASQHNRRKKWTEPILPNTYDSSRLLSSYSRPNYLVRDPTFQMLADIRNQLGHDLGPMPVEKSADNGLRHEYRAELPG